jgi:hypothetical protein
MSYREQVQQMTRFFDHRIGAGKQRRRPFDILTNDKLEAARTGN